MRQEIPEELRDILSEEQIFVDEPMSCHTTFRVGGTADILVCPTVKQVAPLIELCRLRHIPYEVIGNGSNLLVSDQGIRGIVIEIAKNASSIQIDGNRMKLEAGALLSKAANMALHAGLTGLEFAAGIPGSVGGAVVMNAGAYGGEMKQVIVNATVLDGDGRLLVLDRDELHLSYRHSSIMEHDYIVLEAELELEAGDKTQIENTMKELRDKRVEKQPLEYPSAGSTFKRPEGHFAGKLIMEAGLRGYTVGGAQVSEKHCGFVVNKGNATEADITRLMQDVSARVKEQFGVELEAEVRRMGDYS